MFVLEIYDKKSHYIWSDIKLFSSKECLINYFCCFCLKNKECVDNNLIKLIIDYNNNKINIDELFFSFFLKEECPGSGDYSSIGSYIDRVFYICRAYEIEMDNSINDLGFIINALDILDEK